MSALPEKAMRPPHSGDVQNGNGPSALCRRVRQVWAALSPAVPTALTNGLRTAWPCFAVLFRCGR